MPVVRGDSARRRRRARVLRPRGTYEPNWADFREALEPPRGLRVSEWAGRYRILGPEESAEPGLWKNSRLPYLVGPMDAFTDPEVESIVLVFAAQCGKTAFLLNCLGYIADQDPGTTLIVYPTEAQADKAMRHRVHAMIRSSPAVRRHLTGNSDDLGLKEIHFDRCTFFSAWSNSPGALAQMPCQNVILDEVDKFPPYAGREANPIKLAAVRTRTFPGRRKILITSTPTTELGYVWSEWLASNQCRHFLPCPRCGRFQVLDFARVKWPAKAMAAEVLRGELAWYECERCKERIEEADRPSMLQLGRWIPRGVEVLDSGEIRGDPPPRRRSGFHLPCLYSPFVTWSEAAAERLTSLGDMSLMMNFVNSWLGLPWVERIESITEQRIRATRRQYPPAQVPIDAQLLTAGVDVQPDHFWYAIRAWGLKERSWLIRYGSAQTWKEVWSVLSAPYQKENGTRLAVERAFIDSGFRTDEVYKFCMEHRPITWPTKGSNNPGLIQSVKTTRPEAGTLLFTFKVDFYKDRLATLIGSKGGEGEAGEWCTHEETDEEYVKHLTSEQRVILRQKGRRFWTWQPLTESTPNHLLDCEVLNVLAADNLGVRFLDQGPAPGPSAPRTPGPKERDERGPGSSWIEREKGWLGGESVWDG